MAITISNLNAAFGFTEDNAPIIVDNDVTFSGSTSYTDGYIRFAVASATTNDLFGLTSSGTPNAVGAISRVGNDVFLGNGTGTDRIGSVDLVENGLNGQALKILFSSPLPNAGFENGATSWTIKSERYGDSAGELNLDNLSINLATNSDSNSVYTGGTGTVNDQNPNPTVTFTGSVVAGIGVAGSAALSLTSTGNIASTDQDPFGAFQANGYGSIQGPYATSSVISVRNGDLLNLDFKAVGTGDDYQVFGLLRKVDASGNFVSSVTPSTSTSADNIILFAERGADTAGYVNISKGGLIAGDYRFEFVGGTYDGTGGLAVGSNLFVDNIRLTSSTTVTNSVASTIAQQVTYQNTSQNPSATPRVVTITALDDAGATGSGSTTLTMTPVNDPHTGAVSITGTATQNQVLTANTAAIADLDGLGTFSYQWQANGVNIGGATGSTLTLTQAQVGKVITVAVNYTDGGGFAESSTSPATTTVVNVNDPHTGAVSITGTATQNQVLTANTAAIADLDGLGTFSYQWQANGVNIGGATGSTLTLTQAQVGKVITVAVNYTDGGGFAESSTSPATTTVVNVNDPHTGAVSITGIATQNQVLTANTAAIADLDGLGTFSYQWQANGVNIGGATGSTLTLTQAQVGKVITVAVNYTDGGGFAESSTSPATTTVVNVNDPHTGAVSITGTATQNQVLTANTAAIADLDGLGTFSYQWQADGVAIDGATGSTLTLTQAQVGKVITVSVNYTDGGGFAESSASTATTAVVNANDAPTGGVGIDNMAPTQGDVLTASNTLVDTDGLSGVITYTWMSGTTVLGTGSTYTLLPSDAGNAIHVVASYTDDFGHPESVSSDPTSTVINVNDAPTGGVGIDNMAPTQGDVLTASNTLVDTDGLSGVITYTWMNGTTVLGTGSTYTLLPSDAGNAIHVVASYTDDFGHPESVSSDPTSTVINVNDAPTGGVGIDNMAPTQGDVLTASNTLVDTDGLSGVITYTWMSGTTVLGTGSTYTLLPSDAGNAIHVVASYTDDFGHPESVSSDPTSTVINVNDAPTGGVGINNMAPTQGDVLTASNTLVDADGLSGVITYTWMSGTTVLGTGSTYTLLPSDAGNTIHVVASYTDDFGHPESVSSDPTSAVIKVNPPTLTTPATVNYTDTAFIDTFASISGTLAAIGTGGLTYGIAGGLDNGNKVTLTNTHGTLAVHKTTGAYTFTPNSAAIEELKTNPTDTDIIQVTVSDAFSQTVSQAFTVTITQSGSTESTGDDSLAGTAGIDHWAGLTGNDTYFVNDTADTIVENVNEGIDYVSSIAASYTLGANIENLILTGTAAINGGGNALNNLMQGNSADNVLSGGGGIDTMIGGLGNDGYAVDNSSDVIVENVGEGIDSVSSKATAYTLSANVENLVLLAGSTAISGTGNALNNQLTGNSGNNILDGLQGADTMIGGIGDDTYTIDMTGDVIIENAGEGTDTVNSFISYDLTANFENLILNGSAAINGGGNSVNNELMGNSADNVLSGGGGIDTMTGGLGNDTYGVDNASDVVIENVGEGIDTVSSRSSTYTLSANIENLILTGTAAINGGGNALNNLMQGNSADNVLSGGGGIDTMIGGLGNDGYAVDNSSDVIVENVGEGIDSVSSKATAYTLSANVENLVLLAGSTAISGTGNALNNQLTGNSGNNILDGLQGADTMIGGVGDDTYTVENTGDVVTENVGEGIDTVNSVISYNLTTEVENLILNGNAAIDGGGNALNNQLTGNSADNVLSGGGGIDTMTGGLGNDTYGVDNASDVVIENVGEGIDTVSSRSSSYTLANNVENLILTGSAAINGAGNALNNQLQGNSANNTLAGGEGADILIGGLGKDTYDLTESAPKIDTLSIAAGDSLVSNYDVANAFKLGTGTVNIIGVDRLDLASTLIATNASAVNGVDSGTILSHSINNGIISFDDVNSYTTPLAITAANLADTLGYLQANITGSNTVAFVSEGNTFVFQDGGIAPDTLVELVGVTATSVNTSGLGAGAIFIM